MTPDELREIRERLDMTQEELAKALGFRSGASFVSNMETGARAITPQTEAAIRQLVELTELRRKAGRTSKNL